MYYDDDFVVKEKKIKVYKNGDLGSRAIEIKIHQGLTLSKIANYLEAKSPEMQNIHQFRLFDAEGVELFDDDLQYLKDSTVVYASRGEEFDANSTFSEYNLLKVLGEGGFGKVLLGEHKVTKEKVAIKIVKTNVIGNAQDIDMVFREAEILKSLNHKNIVRIKNCFTLADMKVVFVMEYLEGGELLARIEKEDVFSEEQSKIYFRQIVDAMSYCHRNKLIHRDLKLENLLLTSHLSDEIKIVDFGIAGVATKQNVENIDAGSLRYMAPEVLNGKAKQITPAIDVWAMGIILYMMVIGDFPFSGANKSEMSERIQSGAFQIPKEVAKKLSKECIDAINSTLQVDPSLRISTVDLANHPFIAQGGIILNLQEEERKEINDTEQIEKAPIEIPKIIKSSNITTKKFDTPNSRMSLVSSSPMKINSPIKAQTNRSSMTPQHSSKQDKISGFSSAVNQNIPSASRFKK